MIHFIINRSSGKGRGSKACSAIADYMQKAQIPFAMHFTHARGDGERIAREITTATPRAHLVAVGGDGTFHEVLNGLVDPHESALSFLPAGRGNDFARAAHLEQKVPAALERILHTPPRYIDYIEAGGRRCLNVAGTGLDIDVLERVAGKDGKLRYLTSLVYCLHRFVPYDVEICTDGVTEKLSCILVAVCNGVAFGGGIRLNPLGKIDDGKADVIAMEMPKDGKLMKVLPKFVKGKHMQLPITHHRLCDTVTVRTRDVPVELDGEIYRDRPLDCRIVAGGLQAVM